MGVIDGAGDREPDPAASESRSLWRPGPTASRRAWHDQGVALANCGECLLESGPVAVASGKTMVEIHAIVADTVPGYLVPVLRGVGDRVAGRL